MSMTAKFVEIKLCKRCNQNLNYKKFRKVNRLTKGTNKDKYVGWTDIKGEKRFSKCKGCKIERARNRYSVSPIPQMLSNSKIRHKSKGITHTITTSDLEEIWPKNNRCPVLDTPFEIGYKVGKSRNLAPSLDRIISKKVILRVICL